MSKRSSSPSSGQLVKRSKPDEPSNTSQIAISNNNDPRNQALIRSVQRTSSLEAPIVSLAGAHSVRALFFQFAPANSNLGFSRVKFSVADSLQTDRTLRHVLRIEAFRYGELTRQIPITLSFPISQKHLYSTFNGPISLR